MDVLKRTPDLGLQTRHAAPNGQESGRRGFQVGRDSRKDRGEVGSRRTRTSQRPHCTQNWPPPVTQTVAGEREGLDQWVAELGFTAGISPDTPPPWGTPGSAASSLQAPRREGKVALMARSPSLAAPVPHPEVVHWTHEADSHHPNPALAHLLRDLHSSPISTATPRVHLVLGKNKTTLPGAYATFPTNRLERRHLSWPGRNRLLPLPALETAHPGNYPARATRGHSSSTGPACVLLSSPDSHTGCAPSCLALLSTAPLKGSSHTPLAPTL